MNDVRIIPGEAYPAPCSGGGPLSSAKLIYAPITPYGAFQLAMQERWLWEAA
jgi:hypothetical protein